jgi:hypothetical protein
VTARHFGLSPRAREERRLKPRRRPRAPAPPPRGPLPPAGERAAEGLRLRDMAAAFGTALLASAAVFLVTVICGLALLGATPSALLGWGR